MATKLGKEKFEGLAQHIKDRTTSAGKFELTLYYEVDGHYFCFKADEFNQQFGTNFNQFEFQHKFENCKTRQQAVDFITTWYHENSTYTRMLRLTINIPEDLFTEIVKKAVDRFESDTIKYKDTIKPHLYNVLSRGSFHSDGRGLSCKFSKIMKIEYNGQKPLYCHCDNDWNFNKTNAHQSASQYTGVIEWAQEIEDFLINLQKQLDSLAVKVLDFFNTDTKEEMLLRMTSTNRLIENK